MKKLELSSLLSGVAIVISIISGLYTYYNDCKMHELEFLVNGTQNRPFIQFPEKADKFHATIKA
jgi:hypothetical protein